VLGTMGDCISSSYPAEVGRIDDGCDRSLETSLVVTAAIAGSVGVLGGAWLIERLFALRDHRHKVRLKQTELFGSNAPPRLRITPTAGGGALRITF